MNQCNYNDLDYFYDAAQAFNNLALIATTMVLRLINTAPTAGLSIMPIGAKILLQAEWQ